MIGRILEKATRTRKVKCVCSLLRLVRRAGRLTLKAQKDRSYGLPRKHVIMFCTFRICECFLWMRLGHVHESLPGAICTTDQGFCLEMVSKVSNTSESRLPYLWSCEEFSLFCRDPGCDPLSKSVLRTCFHLESTLIS